MAEAKRYTVGNRKVAIIGAGYVGSTVAYALSLRDIAREIVLIDNNWEKAEGEARDIRHGIPFMGTADLYAGDYADCRDCDLIILAVGRKRAPGESRIDLAGENVQIVRSVVESIQKYYTRGAILLITNPVDIVTYKASQWMGLPDGRVFGTGCILDCSRFVRSIADHVGLTTGVIQGYVVGEHGDSQVPVWSRVTVSGIPIEEYCQEASIPWDERVRATLAERNRNMGADIIRAKGKTHYGIATCVCQIADAILNQRPTIACVSSPLMGEHGVRGVALSVPSVVGPSGVQQRIRERWEPGEYRAFFDAAEKVRAVLQRLED